MNITKYMNQIGKEIRQQREDEQRILNEVAAVASLEFAERAAGVLDPRKYLYGFETYLSLLQNLLETLLAGMPPDDALDAVQTGWSAERILAIWRLSEA